MLNEGNQGDGTRKDLQKRCQHLKAGDGSLLVLKNKDKEGRLTIFTTGPVDLNYHNNTSEDTSRLSSSILNSTPVPSFTELARVISTGQYLFYLFLEKY